MEYDVLGHLRVRRGAEEVIIRRGRPRALLLSLLLAQGDALSPDVLIDRLWGEDPPGNPQNALQTLISYLRRTFAAAGESPVETTRVGYALPAERDAVDAWRFERLVTEAQELLIAGSQPAVSAAATQLHEALSLWRGEPLADIAGEAYAMAEMTRLHEVRSTAQELRADALLKLGRHHDAISGLRSLVATNGMRERLHELLMLALYRAGRQGEALQVHQDVRRFLNEELGIDPGPALVRMERLVLTQDPELDWTPLSAGLIPDSVPSPGLAPAVPRHAPPPSPPASRSWVPTELTPLLGRDEEIGRVGRLLADSRLLTLTGPGGAGKTRVAIEVARRAAAENDQRVWFVDLSNLTREEDVAVVAAAALGLVTRPDMDPLEALSGGSSGLLVLDTCEHVVDGAARTVSTLLRACPDLRILTTSRRPLEVGGELAWPVPPLALPDFGKLTLDEVKDVASVQLFMARAAAVRRGMELTESNAADVAGLCVALDGLPLAIELAAAQADVLSPAALRERLSAGFDVLGAGARDAVDRQRGLRATIDWSVQLLDAAQRRFFARLAVFPASFDMTAAIVVAGMEEAAGIRMLTSLVRHSLVQPLDGDRYQLLDSLRAYATELLGDDQELDEVRLRHLTHYARLAQSADGLVRTAAQGEWWDRMRTEIPNLRAALEWSIEQRGEPALGARLASWTAWLWTHEGMLAEADRWLSQAADLVSADPRTKADVLIHIAIYSSPMGRLEKARDAADEAVTLAAELGDDTLKGTGLLERGLAEWALGDLTRAAETHDAAIASQRAGEYPWGLALALVLRSRTAIDAGESAARELTLSAVTAARATSDRHLLGVALQQAALVALQEGHLDAAERSARASLEHEQAVAYKEGVIGALHLLGRVALRRNDLRRAYAHFRDCLERGHEIGHVAASCQALEGLAEALFLQDDLDQARPLIVLAERVRAAQRVPLRGSDRARVGRLVTQLVPDAPGYVELSAAIDVEHVLKILPDDLPSRTPAGGTP